MEKLELKHLAPYLPYGLRVQYLDFDYETLKQATLTGLMRTDGVETTYDKPEKTGSTECHGDLIGWETRNNVQDLQLKPILRPLTDLTKEIEIDGKRFEPLSELAEGSCDYFDGLGINEGYLYKGKIWMIEFLPYGMVELLLEWHFDVFELIDKGLAIDINTINN